MTTGAEHRLLFDDEIALHPIPLSPAALRVGLLPASVSLLIYLLCLPTLLPGGFAGDLVTNTVVPELAPAGNSLWRTLACWYESTLNTRTEVWRLSFFSALLTAFTTGLVAIWLTQQDIGRRAAITAALLFAFGNGVWGFATVPSVLPLAALLGAGTLVLFYQWLATSRRRWLLLTTALAGLSAFHHPHSCIAGGLLIIGAAGRLFATRAQTSHWIAGGIGTLLGLAPFLFLASGWSGSASATAPVANDFLLTTMLLSVGHEHLWVGVPFLFATLIVALWRARRPLSPLIALLLLPLIAVSLFHDALPFPAVATDGTPLQLATASLLATTALIARALDLLLRRTRRFGVVQSHLLGAGAACLPFVLLLGNYEQHDRSRYRYVDDLAANLIQHLPEDALVVVGSDERSAAVRHALLVQRQRPDLQLSVATAPGFSAPLDQPTFVVSPQTLIPASLALTPYGLLYQVSRRSGSDSPRHDIWQRLRFTDLPPTPPAPSSPGAPSWAPPRGAPLDRAARQIASDYYSGRAEWFAAQGRDDDAEAARRVASSLSSQ
ncbi:MAG: hypothetical protein AAF581_20040 [Planctomycetota bacterium]